MHLLSLTPQTYTQFRAAPYTHSFNKNYIYTYTETQRMVNAVPTCHNRAFSLARPRVTSSLLSSPGLPASTARARRILNVASLNVSTHRAIA